MVSNNDELKARIFNKIQMVKKAQQRAREHIADFSTRDYEEAIQEAEQGIRDIERMVA
jgi:hypothetical protein